MRQISPKILSEILADPWYRQCCLCGEKYKKIDLHHQLIYARRQATRKNCILPLCIDCHANEGAHREELDWIMISRMNETDFSEYPKVDWFQKVKYLNEKYG